MYAAHGRRSRNVQNKKRESICTSIRAINVFSSGFPRLVNIHKYRRDLLSITFMPRIPAPAPHPLPLYIRARLGPRLVTLRHKLRERCGELLARDDLGEKDK